jgi:hypothetical protein
LPPEARADVGRAKGGGPEQRQLEPSPRMAQPVGGSSLCGLMPARPVMDRLKQHALWRNVNRSARLRARALVWCPFNSLQRSTLSRITSAVAIVCNYNRAFICLNRPPLGKDARWVELPGSTEKPEQRNGKRNGHCFRSDQLRTTPRLSTAGSTCSSKYSCQIGLFE